MNESWQAVPVIPTEEMIDAGRLAMQQPSIFNLDGAAREDYLVTKIYRSMLSSCPPHPKPIVVIKDQESA